MHRIAIERDILIGSGYIIVADINEGCVIGAGSVVVKPVTESFSISAGNPAKIIRFRT
jgi:acetyltransferase-like isoleucine patch superfamily enzyme